MVALLFDCTDIAYHISSLTLAVHWRWSVIPGIECSFCCGCVFVFPGTKKIEIITKLNISVL
jgi:hypothetical protein